MQILIAIFSMGVLTRIVNWYYLRSFSKIQASFYTFISSAVVLLPLLGYFLGWTWLLLVYLGALLIWLLFDIVWAAAFRRRG